LKLQWKFLEINLNSKNKEFQAPILAFPSNGNTESWWQFTVHLNREGAFL